MLTASQRRVLITGWLGDAIDDVKKTFPFMHIFAKCVGLPVLLFVLYFDVCASLLACGRAALQHCCDHRFSLALT